MHVRQVCACGDQEGGGSLGTGLTDGWEPEHLYIALGIRARPPGGAAEPLD